jgi:acid phosphatase family membrane protein YuiD
MQIIEQLFQNKILVIAASSWLSAGVLKMIIELIINKKLVLERIVGSGGMPSSHTATVVSLVISTAVIEGIGSAAFAISVILAIIVIHDAMGVRLETGKQGQILNKMIWELNLADELEVNEALKEYVGHYPSQVIVGALVGTITSLCMLNAYGIL